MDNASPAGVVRFSPDGRLTAAAAGLGLVAVFLAWQSTEPAGRVVFGAAALFLLAHACTDLLFRPRLTAGPAGLTVRAPLGSARLAWADVEQVRADVRQRHGLQLVTLEIDAGSRLFVLSRRALGADPERVAASVRSVDPRR